MAITVCPVTPSFAAEIGRRRFIGAAGAIRSSRDKKRVRDLCGSDRSPISICRRTSTSISPGILGRLETTIALHRKDAQLRVRKEFADVSNLGPDNEVLGQGKPAAHVPARQPAVAHRLRRLSGCRRWPRSSMRARIPPIGGHTEFADERAAYDALSDEIKPPARLAGGGAFDLQFAGKTRLLPIFSDEERQACRRCRKCLVRTLPESGRKSLYLASHAGRIFGMPEEDGRALIDELVAHATSASSSIPSLAARPRSDHLGQSHGTCIAAPISTICAGSVTCSAPPSAISPIPASRPASGSAAA